MKRRHWLAAAGATFVAGAVSRAFGQPKIPRVGFLIAGDAEPGWSLFRKAMEAQGLVEGRSVAYEYRTARPSEAGRLTEHAEALVKAGVDVIVAVLTPAILAARAATIRVPIVFLGSDVAAGMVKNVARPEGNFTGVFGTGQVTGNKGLQLLRDIKPTAKVAGVLLNTSDPFHVPMQQMYANGARELGFRIVDAPIAKPADLDAAFDRLAAEQVDGVFVQPSLPLAQVGDLALKHRVPAISSRREFVEAGGLIGYGADQTENYRLVAGYVARLLKGSAVGDLPALTPTKFELIVNQKTARALGIALSPMFMGRVDEVLE